MTRTFPSLSVLAALFAVGSANAATKHIAPLPQVKLQATEPIPPEPKIDASAVPQTSNCQTELQKLGVVFSTPVVPAKVNDCEVINPVQLQSATLNKLAVQFPDKPILTCPFALQFTKFVKDSAMPTVEQGTKAQIAKLFTGPGFVCRKRNSSEKMSEHAKGNAVDIEQIQLTNGKTLTVKDAGFPTSPDYAVLNAVRHAACVPFTTVLGPGANPDHASHFHFDMGQHGKSGTYRICE